MKRAVILVTAALTGLVLPASAATNPSSLVMKIFEMRVSPNTDCSNSVTVFQTDQPTPVDMVQLPALGSGTATDGTYHCLMFHIDDEVVATPQSDDGACMTGNQYTVDIFTNGVESLTPDGTPIYGSPMENDPWIYFNDSSEASSANNCFIPALQCACAGPCPLTALQFNADQTHSLVIDFDGKMGDFGSGCTLEQPVMSIR